MTSRGLGVCASHASMGREGRQYARQGRSSAGCGVAADRRRDGRCSESANLQQTCFVLSMDARHMGALSGAYEETLWRSQALDSEHLGVVGFYQHRTNNEGPEMPGGIRDTSVPTLEYGV